MGITLRNIVDGLEYIGLVEGDHVLVHSSLKSFGYVEGGVTTVIDALQNVIGSEGTIVVPTLTGRREDSPLIPPEFDVVNTPAWTGYLAETVRLGEGAIRSLHPTHSVAAIGKEKKNITKGHEASISPCDDRSPYYRLGGLAGKILLIGVDQESNTTIHTCEEVAGIPYHLQAGVTKAYVTGYSGEKIEVQNRLHDWNKPLTDFNKLELPYYEKNIMKKCKIGGAELRLINTADMLEYTIDLLIKDPKFLLKDF